MPWNASFSSVSKSFSHETQAGGRQGDQRCLTVYLGDTGMEITYLSMVTLIIVSETGVLFSK